VRDPTLGGQKIMVRAAHLLSVSKIQYEIQRNSFHSNCFLLLGSFSVSSSAAAKDK